MKFEDAMDANKRGKDDPKWDTSQLKVGNWFSGTNYFKAETINKDTVICSSKGLSNKMNIEISKDILLMSEILR